MKNEKCLCCGKEKPKYGEKCYQDLIGKNAKLQFTEKDYISKQVIQDKIEDLKRKLQLTFEGKLQYYTSSEYMLKISTLRELL